MTRPAPTITRAAPDSVVAAAAKHLAALQEQANQICASIQEGATDEQWAVIGPAMEGIEQAPRYAKALAAAADVLAARNAMRAA